jgi:hypothetical protein
MVRPVEESDYRDNLVDGVNDPSKRLSPNRGGRH